MRRFLLDTSAVIKWTAGTVPHRVKRQLVKPSSTLLVSILTPWEIVIRPAFQKLNFSHAQVLEILFNDLGAEILPVQLNHLAKLREMPFFPDHTEAFDRLILAQAMAEDLILVGSDQRFPQYKKHGLKLLWD
ncbi:MAG: type II toxin-antitoxin system VapC family toxin [Acidobacteriaceae bacterium]|nr:type II toxin-antitoxin system VapC family toxin [Acidobacteriaceae bacterium]MBV9035762.1 type II toxin-antitoxin system VapC family toxin [Acidobacteriaceae bacterium]MBV9308090.1 type II toxin-antitoxin system VapC family toxin [Acidobacteriaceae bacterium]MBV9677562.1 type II toxin-antitoxin system VapC family toxin [Acidobacteriaceae bacterium]MBV9938047.1 type II toxin-antitoxin system VapC family toxin [Acidobacteriaceae bacterium]